MGTTALGIAYPGLSDDVRPPEDMQAMAEDVNDLIAADRTARDAATTAYTPVITGSTSGTWTPSTSTIIGAYIRRGRMVKVFIDITLAGSPSITGATSGTLLFSLPVAAKSGHAAHVGSGLAFDVSVPTRMFTSVELNNTTTAFMYNYNGGATIQHNTVTWAAGDIFRIELEYEAASAP